jgi:tRNA(Ile)-lysidine synthetase-like protein
MKIEVKPGKYVVAVSGGVDSMALLDLLRRQKGLELIAAHFDHGIRPDSAADRELVEKTANRIKIGFKSDFGRLGAGAGESVARRARYEFLHRVRTESGATAIITAHHQDDVIETAIINILRGTNRRGLSSLQTTDTIIRPLLDIPKRDLINYATEHNLEWREDDTNADDKYLRNYVRHHILPKFTPDQRERFLTLINGAKATNHELESLLAAQAAEGPIDRQWFVSLPHGLAKEHLVFWLRANHVRNFDKKAVERLTVAGKTGRPGSRVDVVNRWILRINKENLALEHTER